MILDGNVAIITGAGRGIGRAIALTLSREGATVLICDLDEEPLNATADDIRAAGGEVLAIKADVTKSADINHMVEAGITKYGRIDMLINNAGGSAREQNSQFHESSEEVWDSVIARNLKGVFICSRAVINHMIERRCGRIVNMASTYGIVGGDGFVDYAAAKAGVIGFTKSLAREVNKYGINVNAIAPGIVETRILDQIPKHVIEDSLKKLSINRFGQPQDIANMALFLVSEDSSYITGQVFTVCGGGFIH